MPLNRWGRIVDQLKQVLVTAPDIDVDSLSPDANLFDLGLDSPPSHRHRTSPDFPSFCISSLISIFIPRQGDRRRQPEAWY